ncbi:MAG: lasso peptide biosynthesis PqqD family chaperone [Syntrophales bacterium]|nr:lasso peptide biosynthesis PqqD family chaperone [Syntrophales bacterium]
MTKENISTESIVSQIEDIVASDIDDEKVMMSIEKGRYYGLDPIGSRVWELIEKPVKVVDLIDALLLKYDVDRETCERDVLAFLEELHGDGILQVER